MATTWTSGAFSTTNQYIKYTISITQNSQNITNNTSNVTVKVRFYRTNTGYTTYGSGTVTCVINGTTYTASVDSADKITNSGIILFNKTLNIAHGSNGAKTLTVSAKISHSQFSSSSNSYSHALTTIPRKSTLSVANGTLGTAQTLTVTRKSTSLTHTITCACGSTSVTVCTKSSSTSISFTPPLLWSDKNTTGTTVSVTYTITTYNGSTSIGSNSYTKTCSIPATVKPSCSLSVSDAMGYDLIYGGYINGKSKIKVTVTATTAYGSPIASYSTTANGATYTTASFTTGAIKSSGTLAINATVKDKRGRTGTKSASITVLNYADPKITKLNVNRCNEDGTANDQGEYVKVIFSGSVTSLNNKNTAKYVLKYKKTSDSSYTSVTISEGTTYSLTDSEYIFAADTSSSYNVSLSITDNFATSTRNTSASTGFTLMHFSNGGTGLAIGKIVEQENALDIGLPVIFRQGPANKLLWSGGMYMTGGHTIALSEPVSKQFSGIVLVFSAYVDGAAQDYNFNSFFVSKYLVQAKAGCGSTFIMSASKFGNMATKYLYISDDKIVGNDHNSETGTAATGITYNNAAYVLRYVIGV